MSRRSRLLQAQVPSLRHVDVFEAVREYQRMNPELCVPPEPAIATPTPTSATTPPTAATITASFTVTTPTAATTGTIASDGDGIVVDISASTVANAAAPTYQVETLDSASLPQPLAPLEDNIHEPSTTTKDGAAPMPNTDPVPITAAPESHLDPEAHAAHLVRSIKRDLPPKTFGVSEEDQILAIQTKFPNARIRLRNRDGCVSTRQVNESKKNELSGGAELERKHPQPASDATPSTEVSSNNPPDASLDVVRDPLLFAGTDARLSFASAGDEEPKTLTPSEMTIEDEVDASVNKATQGAEATQVPAPESIPAHPNGDISWH